MSAPAQQRLAAEPAPRMIVEAQRYAAKGWRVLPLRHAVDGRCSCGNPHGIADHDYKQGGKHPIPKEWQNLATTDWAQVAKWWRTHPKANIGIATGEASGIFVLDVDPDNGGLDSLVALEKEHGPLPQTYRVETGSGGIHFYFTWLGFNPGNSAGELGDGLDIRADGGQVVAPPSVSVKGPYTVRDDTEPVPAPEWLVDMLRPPPPPPPVQPGAFRVDPGHLDTYTQRALQAECDSIVTAADGTQNHAINRAAFNVGTLVGAGALSEDEAREALLSACHAGNHPEKRAEASVKSGLTNGIANPRNPWPPVSRPHDTEADFRALVAPGDAAPPVNWSDVEDAPPEGPPDAQAGGDGEPGGKVAPLLGKLPASFYDRREVLKNIRQYAHSMCCSADVVLYATMARLAGMIDHNIKVDTGVKKPASLNLFVGVIDGSGSSKSTSNEASEDLLEAPDPAHREFLDGIPVGTGEGIAEALMGEVDTEDFTQLDKKNEPKIVRVRKQVRHNLYFYIDEGEALIRIGGRDGSSLWPSIRSAWQAGTLGQTNATAERRRFIKRGTYAMGMVAGFQPPNALVVLRDSITGTAQRFVWCLATDPDIPMEPVLAPDIEFGHPQNLPPTTMTIPDEIKRKIRTELVLRNSGRLIVDPLNVHANLAKVKLAALHALLDGSRTAITAEDWALAEEMWAVSCTLRSAILERASREEAVAAQAKREERVEDAVQAHTAVARADARFEVRARWCVKKIREGVRREQLMEKASSKWRKEVPAGYELALSRGWLVEDDEGRVEVGGVTP